MAVNGTTIKQGRLVSLILMARRTPQNRSRQFRHDHFCELGRLATRKHTNTNIIVASNCFITVNLLRFGTYINVRKINGQRGFRETCPKVLKLFSCSTLLSMKSILNITIAKIKGITMYKSAKASHLSCL